MDVVNPTVSITKSPPTQTISSGSVVTFGISITNSGDVPLALIVSDPLADANCVTQAPALLAAGTATAYNSYNFV